MYSGLKCQHTLRRKVTLPTAKLNERLGTELANSTPTILLTTLSADRGTIFSLVQSEFENQKYKYLYYKHLQGYSIQSKIC